MQGQKFKKKMFPEVFFLFCLVFPLSNCLGRCVATQENKRLDCANLLDFPEGSESIQALQATNSTFAQIAPNVFLQKRFTSLKAVVLQHDNIRSIARRAFSGISGLLLLDLSRNQLDALPSKSFESAPFLKVLILAGNEIREIHQQALENLNDLVYLDLARNNLSNVPKIFLRYAPAIKYLDVSNNPLLDLAGNESFLTSKSLAVLRVSLQQSRFSPEFFVGLPNLQILDLSGSQLKVLPDQTWRPLTRLRVLYIDSPISQNAEEFVPDTLEKFVQSGMNFNSGDLVRGVLENVAEFDEVMKGVQVLSYLDDYVVDDDGDEFADSAKWNIRVIQKILLFALLVYLSFMHTMCLTQIFKAFIQKPYQRVYVDEL